MLTFAFTTKHHTVPVTEGAIIGLDDYIHCSWAHSSSTLSLSSQARTTTVPYSLKFLLILLCVQTVCKAHLSTLLSVPHLPPAEPLTLHGYRLRSSTRPPNKCSHSTLFSHSSRLLSSSFSILTPSSSDYKHRQLETPRSCVFALFTYPVWLT